MTTQPTTLHPQLAAIVHEFESAQARLDSLAARLGHEEWTRRPQRGGWSAADCVEHLNRTAESFLPVLEDGIERARALGRPAPSKYRRDPLGWLLWSIMPPPVRFARSKTSAPFEPLRLASPDELCARFAELQRRQIECTRAANGLPIDRVTIASPFDARAKYNVYSAIGILPRHQHRHIWQAEQASQMEAAAGA